jgi:hypothetical protein
MIGQELLVLDYRCEVVGQMAKSELRAALLLGIESRRNATIRETGQGEGRSKSSERRAAATVQQSFCISAKRKFENETRTIPPLGLRRGLRPAAHMHLETRSGRHSRVRA